LGASAFRVNLALLVPGVTMQSVLILAAILAATLIGDYLIKLASGAAQGLANPLLWSGMALYGLTGLGWFFLMRAHSLAAIGVFYSAATILVLTGLGVVVFHEAFGWREAAGVALALAAVLVIGHG